MIVEYSLTKANRIQLARAFREVPQVDLSIACAVEGQMGRAFVDDADAPTAWKVESGPFFYLAGNPHGPGGRAMLESMAPYTLWMPSGPGWIEAGQALYRERLIALPRWTMSPEGLSTARLADVCAESRFDGAVRQMDAAFAARFWGQDHWIDLAEFDSAADFAARGIGFYLEKRGRAVAAAYSSLVCSRGIEISLFVDEDYRRQGMGTALAARLALWCVERGAEAHWDAANPESVQLAQKLGYVPASEYRAYYLSEALSEMRG